MDEELDGIEFMEVDEINEDLPEDTHDLNLSLQLSSSQDVYKNIIENNISIRKEDNQSSKRPQSKDLKSCALYLKDSTESNKPNVELSSKSELENITKSLNEGRPKKVIELKSSIKNPSIINNVEKNKLEPATHCEVIKNLVDNDQIFSKEFVAEISVDKDNEQISSKKSNDEKYSSKPSNRSSRKSSHKRRSRKSSARSRSRSRRHKSHSRSGKHTSNYSKQRKYKNKSNKRKKSPSKSCSNSDSSSDSENNNEHVHKRRKTNSPLSCRKRHIGCRENPPPSSSIIVFGLPMSFNDADLENILPVTDPMASPTSTSIAMDKISGLSRGFGFINFQTVENASEAINYLRNTRLESCELTCNFSITHRGHSPTPNYYLGCEKTIKSISNSGSMIQTVHQVHSNKTLDL